MAHHKPVGKPRWSASQKAEALALQERGLDVLHVGAGKRYDAIVSHLPAPLPIDAAILDIGCGAVCTGKLFNSANTTYLDPLIDDFRRTFPGELPDGEFVTGIAEDIDKPDESYDLILCLNTLGFVLNPELVLHESRRLLKSGGMFAISLPIWPGLIARFHYFKTRVFSVGEMQSRLYCYTHKGIMNTLSRHFEIVSESELDTKTPAFSKEHLFICRRKNSGNDG